MKDKNEFKSKVESIKNKYKKAGRVGGSASDVVSLIDIFINLFNLAENLDPRLVTDLNQDLTSPNGGGDDVINTAVMLKNDLENSNKNIVIAPTGVCVSRAIIVLIESNTINNNTELNKIYSEYSSLLNTIESSI
ncbi:hypothetical protein [Pectobacterium versatile]|uniref:hypothetical protein n=1 Tax=Pectobacterium versatile TaxID=2488639 RepID=UPI00301AA285